MPHISNKQLRFLGGDGFTLVEVMVAVAILVIISLATLISQYYSALHARAALAQMTATRTAQLVAEDWKSAGGSTTHDPTNLNLGFIDSNLNDADYEITVDNLPMYMKLSYNDVENDDEAQVTMRKITVQVNWRNDHKVPTGQPEDISMELSTYVRVDASGG